MHLRAGKRVRNQRYLVRVLSGWGGLAAARLHQASAAAKHRLYSTRFPGSVGWESFNLPWCPWCIQPGTNYDRHRRQRNHAGPSCFGAAVRPSSGGAGGLRRTGAFCRYGPGVRVVSTRTTAKSDYPILGPTGVATSYWVVPFQRTKGSRRRALDSWTGLALSPWFSLKKIHGRKDHVVWKNRGFVETDLSTNND